MIDFGALVLGPAMAAFGRAFTIRPIVSQFGQPPYRARGVYLEQSIEVASADGQIMLPSAVKTLGIRLSEFPIPPKMGDRVTDIEGVNGVWAVDDVGTDGQGGGTLVLKQVEI